MDVLWKQGDTPAKEIAHALTSQLGWNPNTTYTLIKRCIKKGAMSLLEMSLRGGILILAIALVRALTLHHLPKCTFLLLWALAALQLTVPVSLPARFSVYTLVTQLASVSTGKMISGTPLTGTTLLPGTVSLPENADGALPLPVAAASSGVSVWTVLWLAGAAFFGGAAQQVYPVLQQLQ